MSATQPAVSLNEKIPNNVNLSSDRRLQRALEAWQPRFLDWWREMGPEGFQLKDVYLRTAVSVEPNGWAHFDYVKMPDYRWGIFLAEPEPDRTVAFGDHLGEPAWQNWIFTRPNATGERGALTLYGKPERPAFHWTRT